MISLNNASIGYAPQASVLKNLHLSFEAGLIHGVIGANAAGKTTLLRAIAGQINVDDSLKVFGMNPFDNPKTLGRTVLMGVDVSLPQSWTAAKLMKFGAARYQTWDQTRAEELVARFSLPDSTTIGTMSRGQRSAVAFIYAFAARCPLTLLDEPTVGLDVEKRHLFNETLQEERGRTFIVATHEPSESMLDTITLFNAGELILSSPVIELTEGIVEVSGTAESVQRTLDSTPAPLLFDARLSGARRCLLDLREDEDLLEQLWLKQGVAVSNASLEESIRALMEVNS